MPTPPKSPRNTALNLLARRDHTAAELTRKLRLKNFELADIEAAVQKLEQDGLLNNTRFVEQFIHQRRAKGYGPNRIHAELIERGIPESLIEEVLNITDNAWLSHARRVWQKRFKSQKPADFKARAQQMRFLQYRGFTREQIESVFKSA